MRGIVRRSLRLELVAGLVIALVVSALPVVSAGAQGVPTTTTVNTETRDQGGHTMATVSVVVTGEDGLPVTGAISINDSGKPLAGVALNAQGEAKAVLDLTGGDHLLSAEYAGDASHQASVSRSASVHAMFVAGTPTFTVSVAPVAPATFPLTLTAGSAGAILVTVTPVYNAFLTAPMFVTLSCSGLPDQASCTATPENLEILSSTATPPTSTMVIQTYAASKSPVASTTRPELQPIAWAFLLPGVLGLGGLAWGARRRRWLSRLSLLALVCIVTLLGTTGCNPRYGYLNHGPIPNPGTPAGTYTVTVTAQSNNGVTAILQNTTFVLTVK